MKTPKIVFAGTVATLIAVVVGFAALSAREDTTRASVAAPAATEIAAEEPSATVTPTAVTDVAQDEHVLGDADAPITIIEYASLTCPHCASFHSETLPRLRSQWIENGKARLVFRHYPLDRLALAAALMTNCFEGQRFFAVLGTLFETQDHWARAEKPGEALARIGAQAGMDHKTFEACVTDQAEAQSILETQKAGRDEAEVESTPTFLINGEKLVGAKSYEAFEEALKNAEGGA